MALMLFMRFIRFMLWILSFTEAITSPGVIDIAIHCRDWKRGCGLLRLCERSKSREMAGSPSSGQEGEL